MTPEEKIRRGEEAERLLKNETLAAAFAETLKTAREGFFAKDFDDERARAAHAADGVLEDFRQTLRRYVGEAKATATGGN